MPLQNLVSTLKSYGYDAVMEFTFLIYRNIFPVVRIQVLTAVM
jgi:hypothetical protein